MTVTWMDVDGSFGEKFPLLRLDRTRDGLASYCEARWPVGRRKSVAKEWGLSADEARSLCEGSASQATLDKVWRHPRGGWTVLLPVMGAVIGQPIHEFFREQMKQAAKAQEHAEHHERLAKAAYRRLADDLDPSGDDRNRAAPSRRSFGALGAQAARRLGGQVS
jgi:hypothetical protein